MRRLFLFVLLTALLPTGWVEAVSPDCISTTTIAGTFFQNYEQIEYSSSNLLIIHFKISPAFASGRTIKTGWDVRNDACDAGNASANSNFSVTLPAGATDFSLRFSSPTRYELWNDASSTPLVCQAGQGACSQDIPAYPGYYTFGWKAQIQLGPLHSFQSSFHPIIKDPPLSPSYTGTLDLSEACASYTYQFGSSYFFDNYEHAEYVVPQSGPKLLRVHYRLKSPYNDGRAWKARLRQHDTNCVPDSSAIPKLANASTTPYSRYFSLRFTSPTHWEIWNDELDRKEACTLCQGDLPAQAGIASTTSYVSLMGSIDGNQSYFYGTPYSPVEPPPKHSNVLFLPGLEASRLYVSGALSENQLWEPNRLQDVQDLFLDTNGHSINSGIYTRDVIDEVNVIPVVAQDNIYKSFISMMNGLVTDGAIAKWQAYPYDWRADYADTITGGTNIGKGQIANIIGTLESLASSSQTHKVTLIAHSHGGFLAKALVSKLEEVGKVGLLDQLILVAVPQSGTPVAIEALLHGQSQPIFKSLLLPRWLTRSLAEHMQSAYNLLPSPDYFARVSAPVVEFSTSTALTAKWREYYGESIDNTQELRDFALGIGDSRSEPEEHDGGNDA